MKRIRHYDKDLAVVFSVFGSSNDEAMNQYLSLMEESKAKLPENTELRLAVSSRTVLKKQEAKGNYYLTLAEQLANLDRMGYRKVVVSSVNIFPTEEHLYLLRIVDSFRHISNRYEVGLPLFARTKKVNLLLTELNEQLRSEYCPDSIVFLAHGAPNLENPGHQVYTYLLDYLKMLNPTNLFYTIEGAYPYRKNLVREQIKGDNILVVPLLLVNGVHNREDIQEIRDELTEEFSSVIIPNDGNFSLLNVECVRKYFVEETNLAIQVLMNR